jgi:cation transport regulator ChaC
VAYRPVAAERARILEALDHREKAGYQRQVVELHPHRASTRSLPPSLTALVYIATEDNENFTGPQPAAEIATLLATRSGPSGPNIEYFARLRAALAEHGVIDPHIEQLAAALHG